MIELRVSSRNAAVACHRCHRRTDQATAQARWLLTTIRDGPSRWLQVSFCGWCAILEGQGVRWLCLRYNLRIGRLSDVLTPGYSACERCHTNWAYVHGHTTYFVHGTRGFFPLCVRCWASLTPRTRLPYYKTAWQRNIDAVWPPGFPTYGPDPVAYREAVRARDRQDWFALEAAVLAGK